MNNIEKLQSAIKVAEELNQKIMETCANVSCSECILKQDGIGECAAQKARIRLSNLRAELKKEKSSEDNKKALQEAFRLAKHVSQEFCCVGIMCHECPFMSDAKDKEGHGCVRTHIRARLDSMDTGCAEN